MTLIKANVKKYDVNARVNSYRQSRSNCYLEVNMKLALQCNSQIVRSRSTSNLVSRLDRYLEVKIKLFKLLPHGQEQSLVSL